MRKSNKDKRNDKGESKMATQIAPTPIVKGQIARDILAEIQKQPSKESELNAKKLMKFFDGILKNK